MAFRKHKDKVGDKDLMIRQTRGLRGDNLRTQNDSWTEVDKCDFEGRSLKAKNTDTECWIRPTAGI